MASSATLSIPTTARRPARKYDTIIAGPALACAKPGSTKMPELIIAPAAMQKTWRGPRFFLSAVGMFYVLKERLRTTEGPGNAVKRLFTTPYVSYVPCASQVRLTDHEHEKSIVGRGLPAPRRHPLRIHTKRRSGCVDLEFASQCGTRIKKPCDCAGPFVLNRFRLAGGYIGRARSFFALTNVELDFLSFFERCVTSGLNFRMVDE